MKKLILIALLVAACSNTPASQPQANNTSWVMFQAHAVSAATEASSIMSEGSGLSSYDFTGYNLFGIRLENWGSTELAWLSSNEPEDCYRITWANWLQAANAAESAGRHIQNGVQTMNVSEVQLAASDLRSLNSAVQTATTTIETSNSACN